MACAPADAGAFAAQAFLLRLCGRYQDAAKALERALAIDSSFAPSLIEMARLALHDGQLDRAHAAYEKAHGYAPDETQWFDEWVGALLDAGRADVAVRVSMQWCVLEPASPQAWFQLGLSHHRGNAYALALEAYNRALALVPDHPMLSNNLSALHYSMGDYVASLRFCTEAIRVEPNNALAWTNTSNTWLALREPGNALLAADRASALAPNYVSASLAQSNSLKELQRVHEAYEILVRAAQIARDDPKLKWSIAMLQLLSGDYENGWINHEARWTGSPELAKVEYFHEKKLWRGEDLTGQELLLWGEQGFGDALQFVRFVPQIAEQVRSVGGTLTYCCFAPLFPLFHRALAPHGVRVLAYDGAPPPEFDFHLPVGSLPLALGVTLSTLPAPHRYLKADRAGVARWGAKLPRNGRLKVGLVWSGSRTHQRNWSRSVPPALYAQTFADVPGVDFYSLQIDGADEAAEMKSLGLPVVDCTGELKSFDDTSALICNLDLVITVCTSLAHLSGALGARTWLLLDVNPHWVWMTGRADSPWYPTLTLYRQARYADWSSVLPQVRIDLLKLLASGE
ncbi:tetratricopeptide repeat protein [Paraburkholderia bryophila]|uniref:tetratricopeptide repeat protein n=1 Tax=Paraburkholderia bryophila TaxID=420952 RepID=UPI002349115E|nr:tetratricopeptide repeat protein [Paraburkholderia bryophila]WCM22558.1 tetratricopeptide repeat protein [Paraburkholderia bryophila]